MAAYLFEYDSIFGPWKGTVRLDPGSLTVDEIARQPAHDEPHATAATTS